MKIKYPSPRPRLEIWNDADANREALLAQLAAIEEVTKANAAALDVLNAEIEQAKSDGWKAPPRWLARCVEPHHRSGRAARALTDEQAKLYGYTFEPNTPAPGHFQIRAYSAEGVAAGVLLEAEARQSIAFDEMEGRKAAALRKNLARGRRKVNRMHPPPPLHPSTLTFTFHHAIDDNAQTWQPANARAWRQCLLHAHALLAPFLDVELIYPQPRSGGGYFFRPHRLRSSPLAA